MTTMQVARKLGVSYHRLYRLIRLGIVCPVMSEGRYQLSHEDVKVAFVELRRKKNACRVRGKYARKERQ